MVQAVDDYTIEFEAQLVSASMTMNGGHKVTLRINPHDVMSGQAKGDNDRSERVRTLMTQSPNTRYLCVLVQLEDETDEPVQSEDAKDGDKAVAIAGLLCRNDEDFQRWLSNRYETEASIDATEESTVSLLTEVLGISSRSELKTNSQARLRFKKLKREFDEG